ncbi:MAG: caspase family protein [Myxococcales bacterium]|nr:caspase family protein [Myxococcales bacterium]
MPRRLSWFAVLPVAAACAGPGTLPQTSLSEPTAPSSSVQLVPQMGHGARIDHVAFSPSGQRLLTVSVAHTGRLWDVPSGSLVARLEGHDQDITAARFSPAGHHLVTASQDGTARLWHAYHGAPLHLLEGHTDKVWDADFSPDGRHVATASDDGTVRIWEAATGASLETLKPDGQPAQARFLADGRLVTAQFDSLTLWDRHTWRPIRTLDTAAQAIRMVVPRTSDSTVATLGRRGRVALWNVDTATALVRLDLDDVEDVDVSADGSLLATAGDAVQLFDVRTQEHVRTLDVHEGAVSSVRFGLGPRSGDLLTVGSDHHVKVTDTTTGEVVTSMGGAPMFPHVATWSPDGSSIAAGSILSSDAVVAAVDRADATYLTGATARVFDLDVSPDSRHLLVATGRHEAMIWDLWSGRPPARLVAHQHNVLSARYSPDGRHVVTASADTTGAIWDAATGEPRCALLGHDASLRRAVFHPRQPTVLTASEDGDVRLWRTSDCVEAQRFEVEDELWDATFDAEGAHVITAGDGGVRIWSAEGGLVRQLDTPRTAISVSVSPDGRWIAAASHRAAWVWHATTGELRDRLDHPALVTRVRFERNDVLLTGAWDGARRWQLGAKEGGATSTRFSESTSFVHAVLPLPEEQWAVATADGAVALFASPQDERVVTLLVPLRGGWAVTDPHGRFDTHDAHDNEALAWVIDGEPYALAQLRAAFFDPGLLPKSLGLRTEARRAVPALDSIASPARVHLDGPDPDGVLHLRVEDRGGGVGRVLLWLNGVDVSRHLDDRCPEIGGGTRCTLDLSERATWVRGGRNRVRAEAENAVGTVRSRGLEVEVQASGPTLDDPPDLWVLAVGTSDYALDQLDLAFAAADAEAIAQALTVAGERGFGADHTHVRVLSTSGDAPDRSRLSEAFTWLQQADPLDTVVVFLAGHGVAHTDAEAGVDDYFYLLPDAGSVEDLEDPSLRALRTWSGEELATALGHVPAHKRVVILDTCSAGALVADLSTQRELSTDAIRAHVRAQDRSGAWFLAGAAADKISYEASRYGQGVLTYALLEGMRGPAVDAAQLLTVGRWFDHAEGAVPRHAAGIGGIQRPVIRRGASDDFVLGELHTADRARIPLQPVRPVLGRTRVVAAGGRPDRIGLTEAIGRRLRSAASRGAFVVWDTADAPDTWQIVGQYTLNDAAISFEGFLALLGDDDDPVELPLAATADDVDEVATAVVEAATALLVDARRR